MDNKRETPEMDHQKRERSMRWMFFGVRRRRVSKPGMGLVCVFGVPIVGSPAM